MATTNLNPDNGARRWAAGFLGTPENASSDEAGRAYLRRLRKQEFAAAGELHNALRVFQQKPLSAAVVEQVRIEEETRLRADVDRFADEFFRLPMTKRRERWKELVVRCEHLPSLSTRLQDLKEGLDVDIGGVPMDESLVGKLAVHLVDSFPLTRLHRAVARQAFLCAIEVQNSPVDLKSWEKAARYLRNEWPGVAALDYDLVKQLSHLTWRLRRRRKMNLWSRRQPFWTADISQKSDWRWLYLLFVIGAIGRGVMLTKSPDSSSHTTPPPSYSPTPQQQLPRAFANMPPVSDLLNSDKYDAEMLDSDRVCFTARSRSTTTTPKDARPIVSSISILGLSGVPRSELDALIMRASKNKCPATSPGTRPKSLEPDGVKPSNGGKSHE